MSFPTAENDTGIQAAIPTIIQRHYSTIGIEDVFLDSPPHAFPSEYLRKKSCDGPFPSWEIIGTIKECPEDFCVREIFHSDRRIPGLLDEELHKLRVADVWKPNELPQQRFEMEEQQDTKRIKVASKSASVPLVHDNVQDQSVEPLTPAAVIQTYLHRVLREDPNSQMNVDKVITSLDRLHEFAFERVQEMSLRNGFIDPSKSVGDPVYIPPLLIEEEVDSSLLRRLRGDFHRALKTKYPMLYSNSVTKDGVEHWIVVKIDDSFDGIIPYLLDAGNDIRVLLFFKKQGLDELPNLEAFVGNQGGSRQGSSNTPKSILKLKPTTTKDERKTVHNIIAERSKLLMTSTIADFSLEDGTATTAIAIQWDKSSIHRKRKRKGGNLDDRSPDPYTNVLAVLKKRQKEHLTALNKLTQVLKCHLTDIGIAGIKDLQAVTYQFCTFRNMKVKRLENANKQLEKYGMELGNFFRVNWVLNNGGLDGNEFVVILRGLKRIHVEWDGVAHCELFTKCEENHVNEMVKRVRRNGFINFFGEQRVGSAGTSDDVGVRAFDIGRAMLQQNFSQAIELMMTGRTGEESRESDAAKKVRQIWRETSGDSVATLKAFHGADNILTRERMVLKGLNRYGKDRPLEAMRCLSHSVRTFWINAYQSFIWNQVASARIQRHGKNVVKGDLYQDKDSDDVKVVESDKNSISLSQVVLPLPGYNIRYPEHDIGDLYKELLKKDSVTFEKAAPVESSAKGSYRRLVVQPMELKSEMISSDAVKFSFQLPKGCYATMFLREVMLTTGSR